MSQVNDPTCIRSDKSSDNWGMTAGLRHSLSTLRKQVSSEPSLDSSPPAFVSSALIWQI